MQDGQPNAPRVGLYGGAFNPPHVGHLIVADAIRDQFELDEIWWIPTATPPHKSPEEVAPAADRLEMTRRAIADNEQFRLCTVEVDRGGISYTVDTVIALQRIHPETEFSLVMGSDSLNSFAGWHRPEEIAQRVPLLVYTRPGAEESGVPPDLSLDVSFVEAPLINISGTDIRNRYDKGYSIRYLVSPSVRTYLVEHNLYPKNPATSSP